MGRGVSAGGGQSSLGYLFGSGEPSKEAGTSKTQANTVTKEAPSSKATVVDVTKQIPAGIQSGAANNYLRADGQNTSNFITDRPSTKVHAEPGGGSSLGYLFGGGSS